MEGRFPCLEILLAANLDGGLCSGTSGDGAGLSYGNFDGLGLGMVLQDKFRTADH